MAGKTFSAQIAAWAERVKEAERAVFQESAQEIAKQLNDQITEMIYGTPETPNYRRTGFLRASLVASTDAMPQLVKENPGAPVTAENFGDIVLVIAGAELGDTIYLGYTAAYGLYVHGGVSGYGMYGHKGYQAPRPWVDIVAQRWQQIVAEKAAEVKQRFGL